MKKSCACIQITRVDLLSSWHAKEETWISSEYSRSGKLRLSWFKITLVKICFLSAQEKVMSKSSTGLVALTTSTEPGANKITKVTPSSTSFASLGKLVSSKR